jgi:hypothetical protein
MAKKKEATHDQMRRLLEAGLNDMAVLAGDIVRPSNATWQDVAGACATKFEGLAQLLREASKGNHEPFIAFPSPNDWMFGQK